MHVCVTGSPCCTVGKKLQWGNNKKKFLQKGNTGPFQICNVFLTLYESLKLIKMCKSEIKKDMPDLNHDRKVTKNAFN